MLQTPFSFDGSALEPRPAPLAQSVAAGNCESTRRSRSTRSLVGARIRRRCCRPARRRLEPVPALPVPGGTTCWPGRRAPAPPPDPAHARAVGPVGDPFATRGRQFRFAVSAAWAPRASPWFHHPRPATSRRACGTSATAPSRPPRTRCTPSARGSYNAAPDRARLFRPVPGDSEATTASTWALGGPAPAPVANFRATWTAGNAPLAVVQRSRRAARSRAVAWDFGDGSERARRTHTHSYTSAGLPRSTLIASGPGGSNFDHAARLHRRQPGRRPRRRLHRGADRAAEPGSTCASAPSTTRARAHRRRSTLGDGASAPVSPGSSASSTPAQ